MEFDSSSNVIESDMNTLSDLLLKHTDPTLCALNIDEDTNDGTQLMLYQNDDLPSFVDIKFNTVRETYSIPLVTIATGSSIVLDGKQCSTISEPEISSAASNPTNNILIQTYELAELVTTGESSNNVVENSEGLSKQANGSDTSKYCEAVICLDDMDVIIDESSVTNETNGYQDICRSSTNQCQDVEDEITKALLSLGINKEYFITSTASQNSKKQQLWSCPIVKCNFSTIKLDTFKIHLLKHFDRRPFKCKYIGDNNTPCKWAFFCQSKLQRHQTVHTKEVQYMCKYKNCHKMFSSKSNLKCHLVRHEKALENKCPLPNCGQSFNKMTQFHAHMKQHSEAAALHKCEHTGCSKSYYLACALQSHRRIHVNDPGDLICKLCNKKFKAPCRLRAHFTEVHKNIRNYKCTHEGCGWSFTTNSKLRRHMNKHQDSRQYVCLIPDCGKSFHRAEHLQNHVLSHCVNRPKFTCSYEDCKLSFYAKSSLYAHLKLVHSSKNNYQSNCEFRDEIDEVSID